MVMQKNYPNIVIDPNSEPCIRGTRIPVSMIIVDLGKKTKKRDLEYLVSLYPGQLTLEKVQAALDYYKDNKKEIDGYIRESRKRSGQVLRTGPVF